MSRWQRQAHGCLWLFVTATLAGLLWLLPGTATVLPPNPGLPAALTLDA